MNAATAVAPPRAARPGGAPPSPPSGRGTARPSLTAAVAVAVAVALATLSLSPLLDDGWYLWPLVMIVVVVGLGALAAHLRAPAYVVPFVQSAAGIVVLVAAVAPDPSWGPVPTPTALERLQAVLADGVFEVQTQVPPVPPTAGVLALILVGVGVVAMTTYVLAVVVRLPVLAGAPLLGLYLAPAAVLDSGSPLWAFLLSAAGWLLVLVVDSHEAVGAWGRAGGAPGDGDGTRGWGGWRGWIRSASRLGVVALALAAVIPPLVPGVLQGRLGGSGAGTGTGEETIADVISLDPFVSLRRDLVQRTSTELFTYTTSREGGGQYLRTVVADSFDGERWIPRTFDADQSPLLAEADPRPPGLSDSVRTRTVGYTLSSTRLGTPWLPLPSPVSAVSIGSEGSGRAAQWRWDTDAEVAFSTTGTTEGLDWSADALVVLPTFDQLAAVAPITSTDESGARSRQVGAEVPQVLRTKAKELTEGITSPYEQALSIQWWLRENFTYSLDVTGDPDADQLTQFLADRKGYCQQFAATMALMTRSLGITSRVAVGFTPGTRIGPDRYQVNTRNAHAWPELYFSGIGWVRFEPTPRVAADSGVAVPDWASQDDLERLEQARQDPVTPEPEQSQATDPQTVADETAADEDGSTSAAPVVLAVLVVLGIAAALPSQLRGVRRRRRLAAQGRDLAEGAWAELGDIVRDVGGDWPASRTPRQAIADLQARHWVTSEAGEALGRIGRVVETARYAPSAEVDRGQLQHDLQVVREASTAWLDAGARLRVRAFPPTVFH